MVANVAIPTFFFHSSATVIGLVVIASVEALFLLTVTGAGYKKCYFATLWANVMSTFIGIPLAWLLWALGMIPVFWAGQLLEVAVHPLFERTAGNTLFVGGSFPSEWSAIAIELAMLVMLIPFCLGSIWIERRELAIRFPGIERSQISRAVIRGNLVTYAGFLLLSLFTLFTAIQDYPNQKERSDRFHSRTEQIHESQPEKDSSAPDTP